MKRQPDLRWDYAIGGPAACLAVYSAGMGLVNLELGLLFVFLVGAGYAFSAFVQRQFAGKAFLGWSGALYAAAAICSFLFYRSLNPLLPGEGFPDQVRVGPMCWMLAFGSFLLWTESTILFQAVPCIAIFGIVGAFDTFTGAPFAFFIFLICGAVLLSRSRSRDMLRQAADSGYGSMSRIHEGPWKRVAGPQWALTSAAVIVLISLIGAPLIQSTLAPVAGNVKILLPPSIVRAQTNSGSFDNRRVDESRVGSGPVHPGDTILLAVDLDQPRYLRSDNFDQYGGHGWSKSPDAYLPGDRVWIENGEYRRSSYAQKAIKNPQTIRFSVEVLQGIFEVLPSPGEPTRVAMPAGYVPSSRALSRSSGTRVFRGESLIPDPNDTPTKAQKDLPEPAGSRLTQFGSTERVRELAFTTAAGKKTDYEKALAIRQAISRRVMYNLNASAVPSDADAVDHFLFESQEGYCDLFASSMVMMARAIGIPARYVTGFYPVIGTQDKAGRTLIRACEKHAWAELFFKDFGWVPFDATTGAAEVEGYGRGSDGFGLAWFERDWVKSAVDASAWLAAAAALFFLWRGWRWSRVARKDEATVKVVASPSKVAVARLYEGLTRDMARLAHLRKTPSETVQEYVSRTSPALGNAAAEVEAVTNSLVESLFSGREMDPAEVSPFAERVKNARRAVRALIPPLWKTAPAWLLERAKEIPAFVKVLVRMRREDRLAS